ncbi:P-loop containing nucleoside triphosphate hydrolase protein [Biscogniauxia mediterranea]|nr:P-loop containing nucleoside triphosphate hydrolase protein [Biscogniauxia mediterranea]
MRYDFKVRLQPQDVASHSLKAPSHKNAAKILIHPSTFTQGGFVTGHVCTLETDGGIRREAVAWPAPDKNVANNIVSISRVFQKATALELGQVVRVIPGGSPVPDAGVVVMRETASLDPTPLPVSEQLRWQHILESRLEVAEYILPGTPFDEIFLNGSKRSYIVESVNGSAEGVGRYAPGLTAVEFFNNEKKDAAGKLELSPLPAMQNEIKKLNWFFSDYDIDFNGYTKARYSCGVVIHGSHGTGKSMLLDHIAATNWGRVIRITKKDKPSTIENYFKTAIEQRAKSIILIDNINRFVGKESTTRESYIEAIGEGLDALANRAREQNRRPNVLVVATCLDYLDDIPYDLQRPTRFHKHVGLAIPDAPARKEILRFHKPTFAPEVFDKYVSDLGDRTHAYTGADLESVLIIATESWRERVARPSKDEPLAWEDVLKGLQEVRPTAMHDINLKPPTIRWSDIGGYENVKVALQKVLRRPQGRTKYRSDPKKGILLYGPPGCSKTMTAQAMATESGFNFFAVKGGELLNMYVGETERSIRNLFKRAREASPSIIFFDEFDSLAGAAGRGGGGGGTSSNGGSGSGVQALTTLLTEMDGFEQLGDVFVLAATNRPDAIDPALLRPGRFDRLVYVPLPDAGARRAIIAAKARSLALFAPDDDAVDLAELAALTDGYSGAEIAAICGSAFEDVPLPDDDEAQQVDPMDVLRKAIARTPRRVTRDVLQRFEEWHARFV